MPKVFIAYAPADLYFIDLLAELLRRHQIDVEHDTNSLPAVAASDYLLIIVSKNSSRSKAISQEVMTFQASRGKANIIPLLLDTTDPDQIFDDLRDTQGVPFYESMLTGFQSLLKIFGKEFLSNPNKRSGLDRRQGDRRMIDRRKSTIEQRLRFGLWKLYEGKTGSGKFDIAYLTLGERLKAIEVLQEELQKYECFTQEGERCKPSKMELDKITYDVWQGLEKQGYLTAIIVIEAIADKIMKQYRLKPIDRRKDDRRRGIDRREFLRGAI